MPVENLHELLKHELGDLLFAEKTILKALPKMAREVSNPDMRARMEEHVRETEGQVTNLERAFEAIGERAKAERCPGILGLIEEHDDFKKEEEPSKPMLEAFDLGSGLRVEHYEIAAYRTSIAIAKAIGNRDVVALLKQNLDQELAMAKFIEQSAGSALQMAATNAAAVAAKKGAAKKGAAKQGATKKAAAKKGGARKSAQQTADSAAE
jgi:ferritin-like metal-binding protein YciE